MQHVCTVHENVLNFFESFDFYHVLVCHVVRLVRVAVGLRGYYYFFFGNTKVQKSLDIRKNVLTFYVKMSLHS